MAHEKTSEKVGIIGQNYEHRKTKQRGVLESREEDYKNLIMRGPDGKSFNVSYSTFHSSWRKYQGDDVIKTSTQIEEEKAEQQEKTKKAEKTLEKSADKPKISNEEKVKAVHAVVDIVSGMIDESGLKLNYVTSVRGAIQIKIGRRTLVEIWKKFNTDTYDFCVLPDVADKVKTTMDLGTSLHETWHLKTMYSVPSKSFEKVTKILLTAIGAYMKDKEEK